jgi:hypothetical protein
MIFVSDLVLRFSSALLAVVFTWSAVAKLLQWGRWRHVLGRYRPSGWVRLIALPAVPALELAVVLALLAGMTRSAGALTLALLAGFSLAVLRLRSIEGDRLPCGCFGKTTERDYRLVLLRNSFLAILAAVVVAAPAETPLLEGFAAPDGSELLPLILVVVGMGAAGWAAWSVNRSFRGGRS